MEKNNVFLYYLLRSVNTFTHIVSFWIINFWTFCNLIHFQHTRSYRNWFIDIFIALNICSRRTIKVFFCSPPLFRRRARLRSVIGSRLINTNDTKYFITMHKCDWKTKRSSGKSEVAYAGRKRNKQH